MLIVEQPGGTGGGGGGITDVFDVLQSVSNADANITTSTTKNVTVLLAGLAADHTLTFTGAEVGQRFRFKDTDGSLASGFTWTLTGLGTIDGIASFKIASTSVRASRGGAVGAWGELSVIWDGSEFFVVG